MKITIVVPAFNEENRICSVLSALKKHKVKNVIAVNDGSTDRTLKIVKRYKKVRS